MRIFYIVAIGFLLAVGLLDAPVSAETTDVNRTVADSLIEGNTQEDVEGTKNEVVESIETDNPTVFEQQNLFVVIGKLIAALLFVVLLIYFMLRFLSKRTQVYRSTQLLQNLGGVQLGANRSVQLVKVGKRLFVVGVGETIQLLKEIDEKEEIDQMLSLKEEQFEKYDQPINKLLQLVQVKGAARPAQKVKSSNTNEFKHMLKKQLNDVKDSQQKLRDSLLERDKK
ncbi:hypothetical protein GN156_00985 [bacterium LRH843]|nr:hypothetical protein [bacterium LRH843]